MAAQDPPRSSDTRHRLLAGIRADARMAIMAGSRRRTLRPAQVLFMEGEPAASLFVLRKGRVQLGRLTSTGREVVIEIVAAGDMFGLGKPDEKTRGVLLQRCRAQSGEALVWTSDLIRRLAREYPRLSANGWERQGTARESARSCGVHNERTGKLRVLAAEDSDQLRPAIIRILQDTFEIVGAVSSGRALVAAALVLRPDLVVSDLEMPVLSGLAAMQELRDAGQSVPFVLLSAGARNAQRWFDMGVLGVVDKSGLHQELQAAVAGRAYLSRHASR